MSGIISLFIRRINRDNHISTSSPCKGNESGLYSLGRNQRALLLQSEKEVFRPAGVGLNPACGRLAGRQRSDSG